MIENTFEFKHWFTENFEQFISNLNGESWESVNSLRREAMVNFSNLRLPTVKDEEWKYTNITPILKETFKPVHAKSTIPKDEIEKFLFDDKENILLVFLNGYYVEELSRLKGVLKGVQIGSLAAAIKGNSPLIAKHLGKYADYKEHIFTALSSAYSRDGAIIFVPAGKIVESPIHILHISDAREEKILNLPRNLYVLGENSQASIIEHFVSTEESTYLTNTVTEIFLDRNAVLNHVKIQEESKKAFHIAHVGVDQERSSNFVSHTFLFGAELSRNDYITRFNDEGGECTLNGLYLIDGKRLCDVHSTIDHAMPHCNSHEHFKGILDDESRGVFNGKVLVRKDAQKTNAFQENNNIILSKSALVNTKPQLEIFADDVKCSHGATIGQLDYDALFYLKTRGIGHEKAKAILIHAFASDVVRSVTIENSKSHIENILIQKFDKNLN
jgi:Fe-S cluster assembly protein SufD